MHEKFKKPYDPKATEERIYDFWEKSGLFNPDVCILKGVTKPDAESFSVVLPPPNVTGVLHIGHAYEDALQDAVIRFERMRGKRTLFVPGTDSAAIATQARVEKDIEKKEGKNRHDIGREELVRRVLAFAKESEGTILSQVRRMGASLDWSRYAYTLDETRKAAVTEAFKRMYDAGLIYRGSRVVNWDPKGRTTISDDEIVYEEQPATLYTFRYWKDFPIPIATTRPETKVGDTAVAVHPDDPRYKQWVGKTFSGVFAGTELSIRVVGSTNVDRTFGTGAVGVTPAHSFTDWEIAQSFDLPLREVIDERGRMRNSAGPLVAEQKTHEARETVAAWLRDEGLMEHEENIMHGVPKAERTGGVIEPLPKLQWFVAVDKLFIIPRSNIPGIKNGSETTLKEIMQKAVSLKTERDNAISMPQSGFRGAYFHWIDNLRDWCISRQIWFGHRIPVWYHEAKCVPIEGREDEVSRCVETLVSETEPECKHCSAKYIQDPDVLDTWFSSALWTFATLGWPAFTETATAGKSGPENDLANFHPTAFMSPAYEILNLWVSRMILMSGFHLGEIPFRTVLIHGLVRDTRGRKFSKSLGNGVDPIDMADRYGADALRMGLLVGTAIGNDITFDESKVRGYKHFANKLWNIARFVLENAESADPSVPFSKKDEAIWRKFELVKKEVTKDMQNYQLHLAAEKTYHYVWHEFADMVLEHSKAIFSGTADGEKGTGHINSRKKLLYAVFKESVMLLHPFMPFVTEEIWQELPHKEGEVLMAAKWPMV